MQDCIKKCNLKLYYAKSCRVFWARSHLRWNDRQCKRVLWSDESTFQLVFGKNGSRILRAKDEKVHPDCYPQKCKNHPDSKRLFLHQIWPAVNKSGPELAQIWEGDICHLGSLCDGMGCISSHGMGDLHILYVNVPLMRRFLLEFRRHMCHRFSLSDFSDG